MNALLSYFQRTGVEAPKTITLSDPSQCFLVAEGFVDIFVMPTRQGHSVGQRAHLTRILPGGLFFGMEPLSQQAGVLFLAIAAGEPRVLQLPLAQLARAPVQELVAPLERWIAMLCPHTWASDDTADGAALVPGPAMAIAEGAMVRVARPVSWLHVTPALTLASLEEAPWKASVLLPFVEDTCLKAVKATQVKSYETLNVLSQANGLSYLTRFHQSVVTELGLTALLREKEERSWLAQKNAQERDAVDDALRRLAATSRATTNDAGLRPGADPVDIACARVAQHLGVTLKQVPKSGATLLEHVDSIVRLNRIRTRQVLLNDTWWKSDCGPMLAFTEDDAPVALIPVGHKKYKILSAAGEQVVDASVAATLQSSALVFFRPLPDTVAPRDLLRFALHGSERDVAMMLATGMLMGIFGTLLPIASGQIFDSIIPGAQRSALWQMTIGLVFFSLASAAMSATRSLAMLRIETRASAALEAAVWDRLLSLPATFFRRFSAGDLADRANGINVIRRSVSGAALSAIAGGIFGLWNLGVLFFYNVPLALLGTALALVATTVAVVSAVVEVGYQRKVASESGTLNGMVMQLIGGVAKLRNAAAESRAFARWAAAYSSLRSTIYLARMVNARVRQFEGLYPVLVLLVLYGVVGTQPRDAMTTGSFLAFQAALVAYTVSLLSMVTTVVGLLQVVPQFERASDIFLAPTEMETHRQHPGRLDGRIEISHLSFRYVAGQAATLDDINLAIEPGQFVAIVGPSGSGKSSLLRCLLGFEKPESGSIYFSGQDLANVDPREVRRQLGVVLQNNQLMAGSIQENVAGANRLSTDEVWEALDMAALSAEVREMPMSVHTVVSEGGGTLSGGQRQRLLIARALAKKPRLLFFDEATSALDAKSQDQVMKALSRLRVTRIVIAHRLSTIRDADTIVVLVRGKVVQQGTYQALIAVDGPFADLARRQLVNPDE